MRTFATVLLAVMLPAACTGLEPGPTSIETVTAEAKTGPGGLATYSITIDNLTTGQPMTPPVAAIHRRVLDAFDVGSPARFAVKEIAENGNNAPFLELASSNKHVSDFIEATGGPPGPLMPEGTKTFMLDSANGAKYLTILMMLICTNDGFSGLDSIRLPSGVGESATYFSAAYDAGTEINTEDFADIVPPCADLSGVPPGDPGTGTSDPALAEGGVVHNHLGIMGGGDLDPAVHGWTDPVIRVFITRVS